MDMLEHIELNLLAGDAVETSITTIYQPKIREIIDIGEDVYNQYLNILLYDTDLLEIPKNDIKQLGLSEMTTFDFLYLQSRSSVEFRKLVISALEFFFKDEVFLLSNYGVFLAGGTTKQQFINDIENQRFITRDNYNIIRQVLIKMNYLKTLEEEESLEFANDLAREWYLNIKKDEQNKPKQKPQVNLHSIISAMTWRTHKSIDEMLNMTVYQLYDGYHRLFLIDDSLSMRQGIYQGTVDQSKVKPNELNWAKIIKHEEN